jgi:hypothetical protein
LSVTCLELEVLTDSFSSLLQAVAVPAPVTPVKQDDTQKTIVSHPPSESPEAASTIEVDFIETPKSAHIPSYPDSKPPIISPRPKMGSYKKRQAPKPPKEEAYRDRTPSGDSFEELSRRDSITSVDKGTLQTKKNSGRFSLRRLLRMGSKEERPISPESCSSPTSMPSSPESPIRPEIIHPSNLDGRQVEVVSRVQQSAEQIAVTPTTTATTPTTPTSSAATSPPGKII